MALPFHFGSGRGPQRNASPHLQWDSDTERSITTLANTSKWVSRSMPLPFKES